MLRSLLLILIVGAPQEAKSHQDHLKPYEWMVGVWEGKGEYPGMGKYTDEYVIEWTMNKNFMKSTYVMKVDGKVAFVDIGMIGWDADKKKVLGFNFGMDGTIGWGMQTDSKDTDSVTMEGATRGNVNEEFRVTLKKVDKDHMSVNMESKKGDKYVPGATMSYARKEKAESAFDVPKSPSYFDEHLKPLEFLAGDWQGKGEYGGRGSCEAEYTYEWILNKNFLRKTVVAKAMGQVAYSATELIGWDVDKKKIVVFSFAADGTYGLGWGTVEKDALVVEGTNVGPAIVREWRSTFKKDGGKVSVAWERKTEGKYESYNTLSIERKK